MRLPLKKSVVDFVLKEPEIDEDERFLDEDDETPMTIELAGVSEAWRKLYKQSRRYLSHNLHLINLCMLQAQALWESNFVNLRLIDISQLKSKPKMEMLTFQDIIYQEIERSKKGLKEECCPAIIEIYKQCQKNKQKKILPPDTRIPAFLNCLGNLMTAHLQEMALSSIRDIRDFREHVDILQNQSQGSHKQRIHPASQGEWEPDQFYSNVF